jgi:thymidylate synthase
MNNLDKQYQQLLQDILQNGAKKGDRTGTGTVSVFGRQIRHKMSEGFPLLTTKKMYFKGIVTELIWFLRGDTNIKFLVDNGCHIWDGDAFKNYQTYMNKNLTETRWCKIIEVSEDNGIGAIGRQYTQEEFINRIKTDDEFAKRWGDLGPIYGKQWRSWTKFEDESIEHNEWYVSSESIDQISNLINTLKTNPDDRRMMVNAWNVAEIDKMVLPPCHYGFQVYTRELTLDERRKLVPPIPNLFTHEDCDTINLPKRAISLMWNQRSVDTFLGLPFNIASYGLLLTIIAEIVNMVPDELIGNLGDTHLYLNHLEQAEVQISRESYDLPKLSINTEFWPTENGSCGEGPINAMAVLRSFLDDNFCKCLLEDIQLINYQSHPSIKAELSN